MAKPCPALAFLPSSTPVRPGDHSASESGQRRDEYRDSLAFSTRVKRACRQIFIVCRSRILAPFGWERCQVLLPAVGSCPAPRSLHSRTEYERVTILVSTLAAFTRGMISRTHRRRAGQKGKCGARLRHRCDPPAGETTLFLPVCAMLARGFKCRSRVVIFGRRSRKTQGFLRGATPKREERGENGVEPLQRGHNGRPW